MAGADERLHANTRPETWARISANAMLEQIAACPPTAGDRHLGSLCRDLNVVVPTSEAACRVALAQRRPHRCLNIGRNATRRPSAAAISGGGGGSAGCATPTARQLPRLQMVREASKHVHWLNFVAMWKRRRIRPAARSRSVHLGQKTRQASPGGRGMAGPLRICAAGGMRRGAIHSDAVLAAGAGIALGGLCARWAADCAADWRRQRSGGRRRCTGERTWSTRRLQSQLLGAILGATLGSGEPAGGEPATAETRRAARWRARLALRELPHVLSRRVARVRRR